MGRQRRKSLGAGAAVLVDVSNNDDVKERRERRKSLARAGVNSAKKGKRPGVNYDFSSVMTMCSTNKVNLKNSWSLDLIDHIDDVLDQHQGSFQTASRTLQASVQIYEKRVDSTHQDTFKMLENVNRTRVGTANDAEESRETRRKANGSGSGSGGVSTFLESNLSNITFKGSVEREYEVDPLFRKMSKTFDAGGAHGLLLNHLRVHGGPRVIFDTSETVAFDNQNPANASNVNNEDNDNDRSNDDEAENDRTSGPEDDEATQEEDFIDLDIAMNPANTAPVCPSLELLHRNLHAAQADEGANEGPIDLAGSENGEGNAASTEPSSSGSQEDEVRGANPDDLDDEDDGFVYDNEWMMGDDAMPDEFDGADSEIGSEMGPDAAVAGHASRVNEHGRNMPRALHDEIDFTQFDAYSFFKTASTGPSQNANWAGPSHWRLGRKRDAPQGARSRAPRSSKKAFFIDFSAQDDAEENQSEETVLPPEQATRLASISLSKKTQQAARPSDLPQDLHYTVQDLCKLFLKPVVISEVLRRGANGRRRSSGQGLGSPADAASSFANDDDHGDAGYFDNFGNEQDDYHDDAPGGPAGFDDDDEDEDFVQPAHVLEKIHVDYARKAKRIDVKKLKETIWSEIEDRHETRADEQISFADSIKHLAPKIDNAQVTVPFYFISLLHLANENNLELEGTANLADLLIDATAIVHDEE